MELSFLIRSARPEDCRFFFETSNDESVRRTAFNPAALVWENHTTWFAEKLRVSDLFVIEQNDVPVGIIRVDNENGIGTLDFALTPAPVVGSVR